MRVWDTLYLLYNFFTKQLCTTAKTILTSKKAWVLKTAIVSATLLATQVQANDLLAQCDKNWDWKISTRKTYKADWVPRDIAKKEFKCKLSYEIAQWKEKLAQWEEEIKQLDQEIAQWKEKLAQWKEKLAQLNKIVEILDTKK